jgi:chromosome segregation protein
MYLEKLEIQGFKSFAHKNVLIFPGKINGGKTELTSIVGPNGSGKSNVADAVRWALGEQSMKTLRGKKSEDIIFAGSDKKGKLGMAEVSLFLNNEDKRVDLDYSEIVISRRLYRDGESEYLINGSRVRLLDVQMLLAKANFGQKTYSVIGQGLVENFLNTSLSERKEFFDEATGVKQYQIKREDSLNKLKLSLENLGQSQMLLAEIEPRLKALTRQVARFAKKEELEQEYRELSLNYYGQAWQQINGKLSAVNKEFLSLEAVARDKNKKAVELEKELATIEKQNSLGADFTSWQTKLNDLQRSKDELTRELAKLDAWLEMKLESLGKFDLSFLSNKQKELTAEIARLAEDNQALAAGLSGEKKQLADLTAKKQELVASLAELNKELIKASQQTPIGEQSIKTKLSAMIAKLEQAEAHHDLEAIKKILAGLRQEIMELISDSPEAEAKTLLELQNQINAISVEREELAEALAELNLQVKTKEEKQKFLSAMVEQSKKDLAGIERKLGERTAEVNPEDKKTERADLDKQLRQVDKDLSEARANFSALQAGQEAKQAGIFTAQKNLHNLRAELGQLNSQLNEQKINAARYETRLEDLEAEIREHLGDLAPIKSFAAEGDFDSEAGLERIKQLRRQLDAIGAIDTEAEKEYAETKERYEFLSTQVNDLTSTINSLEGIIAELDALVKERFDKEFKIIEDKFSEYFKILFSGGSAKIVKVIAEDMVADAEEQDETKQSEMIEMSFRDLTMKKLKALSRHDSVGLAGIDIVATPPGKKIQAIAMLSGGERALTAIALICAIISANPSPFVILDEVDAALDEANSERLAKILDDLSHKTQFIAITHNRALMRQASVLYGITMGDDGVSKLLSVKLEEASQL